MVSPGRKGLPAGAVVGASIQFGKRTCKPNSVVCGHSSRRRVAAVVHQRPTRRFRPLHGAALRRRAGAERASCSGRALPSLFGLAPCGVYPAPGVTAGAVRSCRTISPLPQRWSFRNGGRTRLGGPTRVLRFQGGPPAGSEEAGRGSRGGILSVALAVHEPLRSRPGRYPAHCPLEFGLSSPESLRVPPKHPAATARSSCQWLVYRT